jgi:hypothetical protein
VSNVVPYEDDPDEMRPRFIAVRTSIAEWGGITLAHQQRIRGQIEEIAKQYRRYFFNLFAGHNVDWCIAMNMTLSDALPVTLALHRAADDYWGAGRRGGILFWDHDLFGTYAVRDQGTRVYPPRPNELTPLPGDSPWHRWVVPSPRLRREAEGYPTPLAPEFVPLVLPRVELHHGGESDERSRLLAFAKQRNIDLRRPVIVAPVRVFRVKGVEITIELFSEVSAACRRRGIPCPYLLVFGALCEDPEYAEQILTAVESLEMTEGVRFLDGVPLVSYRDQAGGWQLDEIDLLRLATTTSGGVFYTPNCSDVESVGLGPALAAVARLPFAVTSFDAFDDAYGEGFEYVEVGKEISLADPAREFVDNMAALRSGDRIAQARMDINQHLIADRFPAQPWLRVLEDMAAVAEQPDQ